MLGEDHPATLTSVNSLAIDLTNLGEHQAARDLDQDTLDRRRVLGEDGPDTLTSAEKLAYDLRALGEAMALSAGCRDGPAILIGDQPRRAMNTYSRLSSLNGSPAKPP